ncbi:hypothetical protein E1A91_A04G068400v1 [Gossypium mustelinum]|uniref:NAC domain-containing protein n=1 Tax=Gossypium mustelinum TaxID=34275 RepID=A0A5D2ZLE8_GOSMU|nr:hypothetical protein E1A91_A04G068400v1 [Gossypium mustelinum]
MSNIRLVEAKLPTGFRFHPRDEELVCDYLMRKVALTDTFQLMIEVDLNKCEPWDIPGLRTNRATTSGYWKATGIDKAVHSKGTIVGMRKTLVFYHGRAPSGTKSDWVMHEFRLQPTFSVSTFKEDWVLCRMLHKTKEIGKKPSSMESSYDDIGSSPLPPLMDSLISFHQPNLDDKYEQQVP